VYKITGAIPASNYIQLPQTSTQSLGLSGQYVYLMFRPVPAKYFVVHADVATVHGLVVRVSFSNLFKEFKSTSTWLQFPFVCHAASSSISGATGMTSRGMCFVRCVDLLLIFGHMLIVLIITCLYGIAAVLSTSTVVFNGKCLTLTPFRIETPPKLIANVLLYVIICSMKTT